MVRPFANAQRVPVGHVPEFDHQVEDPLRDAPIERQVTGDKRVGLDRHQQGLRPGRVGRLADAEKPLRTELHEQAAADVAGREGEGHEPFAGRGFGRDQDDPST